jgi:hypothetical protein
MWGGPRDGPGRVIDRVWPVAGVGNGGSMATLPFLALGTGIGIVVLIIRIL